MLLDESDLEARLRELPAWQRQDQRLTRTLTFRNFADALDFVNRVGKLAEEADHHPDILLHNWNQVTLTLWTHDAGGLTMLDVSLAHKINAITG
ncbi:4a-hydroxytetrahydrobiopterin dehydratase [Chloracidobacterium validum]|uniref:4a-hydroxytetrahydrobiopterin dehydratase n=2 Tax=Chloracidobacterium validum TaxID=2821543 RepID=A0ABX8BAE7_9BACT|nr:4a-hydroxytetrahydrobiopterin dehydratase [Chloracidobacterium validum]